MCSVQWRHPQWPLSTFQGETRRRYVSPVKNYPVTFMFAAAAAYGTTPVSRVSSPVRVWAWRRFALSEWSLMLLPTQVMVREPGCIYGQSARRAATGVTCARHLRQLRRHSSSSARRFPLPAFTARRPSVVWRHTNSRSQSMGPVLPRYIQLYCYVRGCSS